MSWLRRGSKRRLPAATAGQAEASKALGNAEEHLEQARGESREIMRTAERLRRLGDSNDFARRIGKALGGAG